MKIEQPPTAYVPTHLTEHYEQGTIHGVIIAACDCGAGHTWLDKGLGRAHAAAWRSRHQHNKQASK